MCLESRMSHPPCKTQIRAQNRKGHCCQTDFLPASVPQFPLHVTTSQATEQRQIPTPSGTVSLPVLKFSLEPLYAGKIGCPETGILLSARNCQLPSDPCIPRRPLDPFFNQSSCPIRCIFITLVEPFLNPRPITITMRSSTFVSVLLTSMRTLASMSRLASLMLCR